MTLAIAPTFEMFHVTAAPSTSPPAIVRLTIGGDPGDRAVGEPVERRDGELEVLVAGVLELRVREAAEALHEQHHRRNACASDLGGVVERPGWQPVRGAGDGAARVVAEVDQ